MTRHAYMLTASVADAPVVARCRLCGDPVALFGYLPSGEFVTKWTIDPPRGVELRGLVPLDRGDPPIILRCCAPLEVRPAEALDAQARQVLRPEKRRFIAGHPLTPVDDLVP